MLDSGKLNEVIFERRKVLYEQRLEIFSVKGNHLSETTPTVSLPQNSPSWFYNVN